MRYNQLNFMDVCTLDKFVLQGLEDDCYMLVDEVEFVSLHLPVFIKGEMFQIDSETGASHSVGRKVMKVDIEVKGFWGDEV